MDFRKVFESWKGVRKKEVMELGSITLAHLDHTQFSEWYNPFNVVC